MTQDYNGSLTREQFLLYEIRIVASLICDGKSKEEILSTIYQENLFQFPTERMTANIVNVCFKRIDALDSSILTHLLSDAPIEVAKQVNLYAIMKYNRLAREFMTEVIGEKYRTQDFSYSKRDINAFFSIIEAQSDTVASWSDTTISKIKSVLKRMLLECGYLDSVNSETLNPVLIASELENEIRAKGDILYLSAFNCFH